MNQNSIKSSLDKQDKSFEKTLRPDNFEEFIGQEKIQKQLEIIINAAKKREEALGHCLFFGPPGLGKTTLANIIAKSMQSRLVTTSGAILEKPADLAGILTNLQEKDVLFIDEIHRLPRYVEEYLYPAMEEFKLDLLIDSGPNARSVEINLNKFTLIGATTKSGAISSPMRSRFLFQARLDYYKPLFLQKIIQRSANILNLSLESEGSLALAERARGTPRIANNLLRWLRDYCQTKNIEKINKDTTIKALEMLEIDHLGLDDMDKKILSIIIENYNSGPVGIKTIAVALGEDPDTIAEVYEPFLIMQGLLKRTARGRQTTNLAYEHMKKTKKMEIT